MDEEIALQQTQQKMVAKRKKTKPKMLPTIIPTIDAVLHCDSVPQTVLTEHL